MRKDERDLLEVLKFELKFPEDSGYGRFPKASWRAQLIFKDSRNGGTTEGTPLYQKQDPKCANPACPTAFHWTTGGKFFRFRPDTVSPDNKEATGDPPGGIHGVRHYWLCGRCSHVFTLVYDPQYGVVLKLLWPELQESADLYKKAA